VRAAARVLLALACAALLAACSGGADPDPGPEPAEPPGRRGTGYFVGRSPEGLGAAVDLRGNDPASRAVAAALVDIRRGDGRGPVVAIASVVNDGTLPVSTPRFVAVLFSGGAAPLQPAREALAGRGTARAALAASLLEAERAVVPAGDSAVLHLVLRGAAAPEVESMRMVVVPGEPIALGARGR
jgi:hypothetical protein